MVLWSVIGGAATADRDGVGKSGAPSFGGGPWSNNSAWVVIRCRPNSFSLSGGQGNDDDIVNVLYADSPWRFGSFCFLRAGDWGSVVDVRRLVHECVLYGWINTDDVFLDVLFCVSACVHREIICVGCVQGVCSTAGIDITHMVAGGWGNGLSLQSGLDGLDVVNDCFVRSAYRLAGKSGWFSSRTASGGLLPLLGYSSSGASELLVIEAPDPLLRRYDGLWPSCSAYSFSAHKAC